MCFSEVSNVCLPQVLLTSRRGLFDVFRKKPTEEEAAALVEAGTEKRMASSTELKNLAKHNLTLLKAKR